MKEQTTAKGESLSQRCRARFKATITVHKAKPGDSLADADERAVAAFQKPLHPDKRYTVDYVGQAQGIMQIMDEQQVFVLLSGTGTGKTCTFCVALGGRVSPGAVLEFEIRMSERNAQLFRLCMSTRCKFADITVANQIVLGVGSGSYRDASFFDLVRPGCFTTSIESITKLPITYHADILFLDEVTAVQNQLISPTLTQNGPHFTRRSIERFLRLARGSKQVWAACADLSQATVDMIEAATGRKAYVVQIDSNRLLNLDMTVYIHETWTSILHCIVDYVCHRKLRVHVCGGNRERLLDIQRVLRSLRPGLKIVILHRFSDDQLDDKVAHINQWIQDEQIDVLIHSPVISHGVDISIKKYFSASFYIANQMTEDPLSALQASDRVRDCTEKHFFIQAKTKAQTRQAESMPCTAQEVEHELVEAVRTCKQIKNLRIPASEITLVRKLTHKMTHENQFASVVADASAAKPAHSGVRDKLAKHAEHERVLDARTRPSKLYSSVVSSLASQMSASAPSQASASASQASAPSSSPSSCASASASSSASSSTSSAQASSCASPPELSEQEGDEQDEHYRDDVEQDAFDEKHGYEVRYELVMDEVLTFIFKHCYTPCTIKRAFSCRYYLQVLLFIVYQRYPKASVWFVNINPSRWIAKLYLHWPRQRNCAQTSPSSSSEKPT